MRPKVVAPRSTQVDAPQPPCHSAPHARSMRPKANHSAPHELMNALHSQIKSNTITTSYFVFTFMFTYLCIIVFFVCVMRFFCSIVVINYLWLELIHGHNNNNNDCCVVDCFPVPYIYDNWEQDGAHRLDTLGRVDWAWGASTLGRYDFGAHRPDTATRAPLCTLPWLLTLHIKYTLIWIEKKKKKIQN